MFRPVLSLTLAIILAACSNQSMASDEELEEFDPPTVQLRGDVVPRVQRRFERLDKNKDGFLTVDEIKRDGANRIAARDVNGDGKLSRSELVEGALARFDRLDADHDQQVTPQERSAGSRN